MTRAISAAVTSASRGSTSMVNWSEGGIGWLRAHSSDCRSCVEVAAPRLAAASPP